MMYSATQTWSHAVVKVRVLTVETGTFLMESDCNLILALLTYMSLVQLSELSCIVGTIMPHLVYIAVLLRPMQSIMTMVERLCMQDCMLVEVSVHTKRNLNTVNNLSITCIAGDVIISDGMIFTVDSDLNRGSPLFTLTCTSTGGPATTVTWTRDSETVSGGVTVLQNATTAQYTHTLTVSGRQRGHYQCTVSNNKPSEDTAQLTLQGMYTMRILSCPQSYLSTC